MSQDSAGFKLPLAQTFRSEKEPIGPDASNSFTETFSEDLKTD